MSVFSHVTRVHLHPGNLAKLAEDYFGDDNYPFLESKPVEFQLKDEASCHPWSLEGMN
jgi:hypothetical protein